MIEGRWRFSGGTGWYEDVSSRGTCRGSLTPEDLVGARQGEQTIASVPGASPATRLVAYPLP